MKRNQWFGAVLVFSTLVAIQELAQADEAADKAKEIAECQKDNEKLGQTPQVLEAWCGCIWDVMPDEARDDIDDWAKKNKKADEECGKKAGWKD